MRPRPLRILAVATYYRPYLSGLTVYLQRVAESLAACGQRVTVLTSRFPRKLPATEEREGVRVVRVPVALRLGKGVLMPALYPRFWREVKRADACWLILPQADAAPLAWLAKRAAKPFVVSYLCDLTLGGGWLNRITEILMHSSHRTCLRLADAIVALSADYAVSSPVLKAHEGRISVIPPPVPRLSSSPEAVEKLRASLGVQPGERVVGFVGRVSREKGLHVLAQAMPQVWEAFPEVRVLCVGPRDEVVGEGGYLKDLQRTVQAFGRRWVFLGICPDEVLGAFYRCCDVLVCPSVNRTEAFGMVQVEGIGCGIPVVASDLPGVREPVTMTGMGLLVPPADPQGLAGALRTILGGLWQPPLASSGSLDRFRPSSVAEELFGVFSGLCGEPLAEVRGATTMAL